MTKTQMAVGGGQAGSCLNSPEIQKKYKNAFSLAEALNVHPADLFLRNTSLTQTHIRKTLEERIFQDIKLVLQENLG